MILNIGARRRSVKGLLRSTHVRAVIFDLDGTLVDSLRDIAEAMDDVLVELELPRRTLREYESFIGDGARMLVRRALGPRSDLEERALAAFRAQYFARLTLHTRPYDGIETLLEELAAREVPSAVLSNKPHPATVAIVEELFGAHPFAAVLGQRSDIPQKPDPSGALELARILGREPGHILFVGDTSIDIRTAHAAGMIAVGVAWGMRSRGELRDAGAAHIVDVPADLLALLG